MTRPYEFCYYPPVPRLAAFDHAPHPYGKAEVWIKDPDTKMEVSSDCELHDGSYYVTVKITPPHETTLPEYVAAYIKHECYVSGRPHLLEELSTWVANAFEAYEEGAR